MPSPRKIFPSPDAGSDPNQWYGVDHNALINNLYGQNEDDPFVFNIDRTTIKHSIDNVAGDILVSNGTRYERFPKGTALQSIRVKADNSGLEYYTSSSGAHRTTHVVGGSDAFVKTDTLDIRARFVDDEPADTTSNSNRIYILNKDLKYWTAETTPTLQQLERIANKNAASGYAGLDSGSRIAKAQGHSATVYNDQNNNFNQNEILNARGIINDIYNNNVIWGAYYPTTNNNDIGILNGTTTSGTASISEDTNGQFRQLASGTTAGTVVGKKKDAGYAQRSWNCFLQLRFNVSHATADIRTCHGFTSTTSSMSNDDVFITNTQSGVLVGFRTTDTNWTIFYNDGSGAMLTQDLGVAKDTGVHKMEIRAIAADNSFVVKFDSVTPVTLTTRIPAATTLLSMRHQAINATATDINLKMRGIYTSMRI